MMTVDQMLAVKKRYAHAGRVLHDLRYCVGGAAEKPVVRKPLSTRA
jgi:hypothetical protein